MARYKHISDSDRLIIEQGLKNRLSLKQIASTIGKHHSTVAREVRARATPSDKGAFGRGQAGTDFLESGNVPHEDRRVDAIHCAPSYCVGDRSPITSAKVSRGEHRRQTSRHP